MTCECTTHEDWIASQRIHAGRLAATARAIAEMSGMCDEGRAVFHQMIVEALTVTMSADTIVHHVGAISQGVH